jgi:hypothetical protein
MNSFRDVCDGIKGFGSALLSHVAMDGSGWYTSCDCCRPCRLVVPSRSTGNQFKVSRYDWLRIAKMPVRQLGPFLSGQA